MKKHKEIEVRIRHHAKKLLKFSAVMKEILEPLPKVYIGTRSIEFKNKNGVFYIRGWMKNKEYVGIKITKGTSRSKGAIFLRVEE